MNDYLHTCSYECVLPECVLAQRNELVARFVHSTESDSESPEAVDVKPLVDRVMDLAYAAATEHREYWEGYSATARNWINSTSYDALRAVIEGYVRTASGLSPKAHNSHLDDMLYEAYNDGRKDEREDILRTLKERK